MVDSTANVGGMGWLADTRTSYDTVAEHYADQVRDSLTRKPYLRAMVTLFADPVRRAGDGTTLKTDGYGGHPMNVHVHRRPPARMTGWLHQAGFAVEARVTLDPEGRLPGTVLFAR